MSCRLNRAGVQSRAADPSEWSLGPCLWSAAGCNRRSLAENTVTTGLLDGWGHCNGVRRCWGLSSSYWRRQIESVTYLRLRSPVAGARMRGAVVVLVDVVRRASGSAGGQLVLSEDIWAQRGLVKGMYKASGYVRNARSQAIQRNIVTGQRCLKHAKVSPKV